MERWKKMYIVFTWSCSRDVTRLNEQEPLERNCERCAKRFVV